MSQGEKNTENTCEKKDTIISTMGWFVSNFTSFTSSSSSSSRFGIISSRITHKTMMSPIEDNSNNYDCDRPACADIVSVLQKMEKGKKNDNDGEATMTKTTTTDDKNKNKILNNMNNNNFNIDLNNRTNHKYNNSNKNKGTTTAAANVTSNAAAVAANNSIKAEQVCPPTSGIIGSSSWTLLHSMAAWYPDKPTTSDIQQIQQFYQALARFYPCPWCASDFQQAIKESPVRATTRTELCQWLCEQHNTVNTKLGKPVFPCDIRSLDERWRKNPNCTTTSSLSKKQQH